MMFAPATTAPRAALSVLLVEDSDDDALLIDRMLRRAGSADAQPRARCLAEALEALGGRHHDCVLLDLSLPDADELEGLQQIRAVCPEVPIVVLTGRQDDVGAAALQHGAQEYLVKGRIDAELLARTVRYAAERMAIARELTATQARFRSAFENGPLGMALVGLRPPNTGRVREANHALARILDRPVGGLSGLALRDVVHWQHQGDAMQLLDRALSGAPETGPLELRVLQGSGRVVWVSLSLSAVAPEAGLAGYGILQAQDITRRKRDEEELREATAALDNAVGGVSRVDLAGCYAAVNPAYADLVGTADGRLLGSPWQASFHPGDRAAVAEAYEDMLGSGRAELEARMLRNDATVVDAALVLVRNVAADGTLKGHFCFARDITERRRAARALADSERRYRQIVETTAEGVLTLDRHGSVRFVNRRGAELLGGTQEAVVGRSLLGFIEHSSRFEVRNLLERCRAGGVGTTSQEDVRLRCSDGAITWGLLSASATADEQGRPDGTLVMITDITDRKRVEVELANHALRDTLTGLANRALLLDRLAHALRRHAREETGVALLFLDLDRFKLVNDELGHSAGDELLKRIVPRIQQAIRSGDTLARFGGDEFVVLCEDIAGEYEATAVAQRILAAMEAPVDIGGSAIAMTVSIGLATSLAGAREAEDLVRDADTAMYRAKEQGGGRVEVYDDAMRHRLLQEVGLERDLRRALATDQLHLAYQPIVSLPDGLPIGFEALLRWEHPERGAVPPGEFIPLAERTGLIGPIGDLVLREACRQVARWHADHPDARWARVTVNVSAVQLAAGDLAATTRRVLRESGIPPETLGMEITETALLGGSGVTATTLRELKEMGVRLLLDDFGTGFSAISHLVRHPVDGLKIDRSFVASLQPESDRTTLPVVEGIIGMAEALGVAVVAEGVETAEQLRTLSELHCGYAQGFHFARPMSPAAAVEWALAPPQVASGSARGPGAGEAETVTMKEATAALDVSPSTLRRWADTGRIQVVRTPGGHRRIPLAEIRRLNRARSGGRGTVRPIEPSERPLPTLASLLDADGARLARMVLDRLYESTVPGVLSSPTGQVAVERWLAGLRMACHTAAFAPLRDDARALLRAVRAGGGTLLECQAFLERYGDAAAAAITRTAAREEVVDCRRLFLSLRHTILEAAE